jgi:hypothetical protein
MNGKRNYSQFKSCQTPFLLPVAINKVCFILAAFVPGALARSIQKGNRYR